MTKALPSKDRRSFSRALIASSGALALNPLLRARAETALSTLVQASTTNLTSNNERMVSYRHQQHMWQTPDAALHLVLNRGTLTPGPGLSLFSSFDGGTTWLLQMAFAETDDKSTADVHSVGNDAKVAYHTADSRIIYAQLTYEPAVRMWTVGSSELAYASTQIGALNPALSVDDQGTVWVGFLARTRSSSAANLRVVYRAGGGNAWTDPGLTFGPSDGRAVERSARPVRIPGGMGMVWTVREVSYWSTRTNTLPPNSPWTTTVLFPGIPAKPLADPYASHFNVVTDHLGGVHFATVEDFDILYFRLDNASGKWSAPLRIDDSRKVAYAQLGISNGKLVAGFSVQRGRSALVVSVDGGVTWTPAFDLNLPPAGPGLNYNTARVELPAGSTGNLPMLQQYAEGNLQRLMLFKVPTL